MILNRNYNETKCSWQKKKAIDIIEVRKSLLKHLLYKYGSLSSQRFVYRLYPYAAGQGFWILVPLLFSKPFHAVHSLLYRSLPQFIS